MSFADSLNYYGHFAQAYCAIALLGALLSAVPLLVWPTLRDWMDDVGDGRLCLYSLVGTLAGAVAYFFIARTLWLPLEAFIAGSVDAGYPTLYGGIHDPSGDTWLYVGVVGSIAIMLASLPFLYITTWRLVCELRYRLGV